MKQRKATVAAFVILLACGLASQVNAQCSAQAYCGDYINTVSCQGTSSCSVHTNYVVCDGQPHHCTGCYAYCQNDPSVSCYSHSGQCSSWFDNPTFTYWISCSGSTWSCPDCGTPWCG